MVLDTSAVLAILQNEPERRKFNEAIDAAETRSLSTASMVECSMIVESRYGADGDPPVRGRLMSVSQLYREPRSGAVLAAIDNQANPRGSAFIR